MFPISLKRCAAVTAAVLLCGCAGKQVRDDAASVLTVVPMRPSPTTEELREQDAALASDASLSAVLKAVAQHNPDLREAELSVGAAVASARVTSRLPDPELMYEQWAVPLAEPYNLGRAQMLMLGVRQQLPGYGVLSARGQASVEEARGAAERVRARRVDLFAQARRTYVELLRLERELELHVEHATITEQLLELSRVRYRNGTAPQEDLLRISVDLARLHAGVFNLEQQRGSARALLNALMGRAAGSRLGRLSFEADAISSPFGESANGNGDRPDVRAAERAISAAEASAEAADKSAKWPMVMLGVDYMYMPLDGMHAYGATVGITLPWLNPRNDDEAERAALVVRQRRAALDSSKNLASYEQAESRARFEVAARTLKLIREEIVPQAARSFEATRTSYSSGQGDATRLLDATRAYLDVRIDEARALARVQQAYADGLRAMGRDGMEQRSGGQP